MDLQALHEALKNLTPKEYDLIYKLYLSPNPMTERQISALAGIPQQTINCRRQAVLRKLRKFL
jgi:FixJ family two-component response regulator